MDIDKVFPGHIIRKRDIRSIELSYRRYGRLKATEKKIFDGGKGKYTPLVWKLALHIKATLKKPFKEKYFEIAQDWIVTNKWDDLVNYNQINGRIFCLMNSLVKWDTIEKYLHKELVFEGFIPLSEYNIKDKFGYIITNRRINNDYMILPKKLWDNVKIGKKLTTKYPHYQKLFGYYGITGITKYKYSNI